MENSRGWFDDPYGRYPRRYFNGEEWTDQVQVATGEVVTETTAAVETNPPAEPSPDTPFEPLSVEDENPKEKSKRNSVAIAIGVLLTLSVIGAITEDEEASNESSLESAPTEGVGSQSSASEAEQDSEGQEVVPSNSEPVSETIVSDQNATAPESASAASTIVDDMVSEDTSQPAPTTNAPITTTTATPYMSEAFDMAASYLRYSSFSRDGLINQLEYEGYTTEEATAAVDAQGADWNAQAVGSAESYLGFTAFSRQWLIEQLEFDGYTNSEATFGVDAQNADWNEQASQSAKDLLSFGGFSRQGLIDQLEYEGYTNSEATFGADAQNADWNDQASRVAQSYLDFAEFTRQELINQLLFDDFSQSEAEYGVNAVGL
jgi:colicin import membrane protein